MDNSIQSEIEALVAELKVTAGALNDPVAKLMVASLVYQAQKIKDEITAIPDKVVERLCSMFVPKDKVEAVPALCLVSPSVKAKREIAPHVIADGTFFSYKIDSRQSLTYYPLFKALMLPYERRDIVVPDRILSAHGLSGDGHTRRGTVWCGLEISSGTDTLRNATFFIRNCGGMMPRRIALANEDRELAFAKATSLDELEMAVPFDSQQMTPSFLQTFSIWRRHIEGDAEGALVVVTDPLVDRDAFKCKGCPKEFRQYFESQDLEQFDRNILWISFDFGPDFDIPDNIEIIPNVVPVVNVAMNSVTLTQSSPVARLTKNDGSFFLSVMESTLADRQRGFGSNSEEFVIRDFDTTSYNPATLYKDVRTLYNRFIDDYHAFVDYHGLKDGESLKALRETVNRIGKSVLDNREVANRYDEGVFAMRNVALSGQAIPVKVNYLTTYGALGNTPVAGEVMENRKDPALGKEVRVITPAECGEDKADADSLYEMLRYYTLTADRLFTKMDIDAFLRLQLLKVFGREEMKRISFEIKVEGAGGAVGLRRGLYIDISFKDEKNYRKAVSISLIEKLRQLMDDKSCIAMPIIINIKNADL